MAVDDLDTLHREAPELFSPKDPPSDWEEDWIFVEIEEPEGGSATYDVIDAFDYSQERQEAYNKTVAPDIDLPPEVVPPDFGPTRFPGAPTPSEGGRPVPPPDCLAFYLPFHYFYPKWWGIYLVWEGVQELARILQGFSGGALPYKDAYVASRIFIYGHEAFHHIVESFAARLEVSHRKPLYRTGFDELYRKQSAAGDSIEEALASAHGYRRVKKRAFMEPDQPEKRAAALKALAKYIEQCPPGYNRAMEFVSDKAFIVQRSIFSEDNHNAALPEIARLGTEIWKSFSHAFRGIGRVNSSVNYAIHRNSSLFERIRASGLYLRPRELAALLEKYASCTRVRYKGGSHEIWRRPDGRTFPVPTHAGDLRPGTLRTILRQAGLKMSLTDLASLRV